METSYKEKYEQAIERLKQWDREHPCAGFVLSDRDKFIFPELAESEDEKMMKEIIELVMQPVWKTEKEFHRRYELCAWLKKQVEHANFLSKIQVGDKVTRNEDGYLVNLSQLNRVAKKNEKQGEQKASYTTIAETGDGGINALVTLPIEMKTAEESLGVDSGTYNKIVDECIFGEQKTKENKGNIVGISANSESGEEK